MEILKQIKEELAGIEILFNEPLTTWSARKLIVATAWMAEKIRPTKPPARRDNQIVMPPREPAKVKLNTTPVKAPITMIPSKPTLTTPACSE